MKVEVTGCGGRNPGELEDEAVAAAAVAAVNEAELPLFAATADGLNDVVAGGGGLLTT